MILCCVVIPSAWVVNQLLTPKGRFKNYVVKQNQTKKKTNNIPHAISASDWQRCPFWCIRLPRLPLLPWRWDGGSAKRAGSGGAPGSGSGGTVDICRGWRAQCTGNGVSRRLLVGHYPGILMKCGQFAKGGLWMAC